MKQVEVLPNLMLNYLESKGSDQNKPPLVLLHGFTGSAETMEELAATQTHHTTFCLDIIGHGIIGHGGYGKTNTPSKKAFSFKSLNIQLLNFCKELNLKQIHLLGYSMGGRIALNFATSHTQHLASLTLISTNPGLKSPYQRYQRRRKDHKIVKLIQNEGIDKFSEFWMAQPIFATQARLGQDWLTKALQQRLQCNPKGLILSLKGLGLGKMPQQWGRLSRIDIPTLIITGIEDKKFTQLGKRIQTNIKNSQHIKIENTGHSPHLEAPELVGQHIHKFFHFLP